MTLVPTFKQIAKNRYDKHYHPRHPWSFWHKWIDISLVTLVFLLAGTIVFILFQYTNFFSQTRLDIQMRTTPEYLESGSSASLEFLYKNISDVDLLDVTLDLQIPSVFVVEKVEGVPYHKETGQIRIADLPKESQGKFVITGHFLASVGSVYHVLGATRYSYGSKNKSTEENYSFPLVAHDTAVLISLDFAEKAVLGQEVSGTFRVTNASMEYPTPELFVVPSVKVNSIVSSTLPLVDGAWQIGSLGFGESSLVSLRLNTPDDRDLYVVGFKVYYANSEQDLFQVGGEKTISLVRPSFDVTLTNDYDYLSPGQEATFSVEAKNNERFTAKNVRVTPVFDNRIFDRNSLSYRGGFSVGTAGVLGAIDPGASQKVQFSLNVLSSINPATVFQNKGNSVPISLVLTYEKSGDESLVYRIKSNMLSLSLNSDLRVDTQAVYFTAEGEQLGRGAYPPAVNAMSRYWVFVKPLNTLNLVRNVVVTATVPSDVICKGGSSFCSSPNVSFDEATRKLRWTVNVMSGFLQYSPNTKNAAFELQFTPTSADRGKTFVLLRDVTITGIDDATKQSLKYVIPVVSTADVVN